MQVDQEALAKKASKLTVRLDGKENNSPRLLLGKGQGPLARTSSLRPALSQKTNRLPSGPLSSPKTPEVDMEQEAKMAAMVCSLENKDACLMCGS